MGMLRPLTFVLPWAQPRICVRNWVAVKPAIALRKKDLLFMRTIVLALILVMRMRNGDSGNSAQGSDSFGRDLIDELDAIPAYTTFTLCRAALNERNGGTCRPVCALLNAWPRIRRLVFGAAMARTGNVSKGPDRNAARQSHDG